jgi:hypothetical protein
VNANKPNPNDKYWELIRNPAARTYFFIAMAGAGVASVAMFLFSSPIAAGVLFLCAVCGTVMRWTGAPAGYVVSLAYFSIAPLGVPEEFDVFNQIPASHFRLLDIVVIGGSLVYLFAQYRFYAILHSGMPFEAKRFYLKATAKPLVRPSAPLPDAELGRFFIRLIVYLIAGQVAWFCVANLRVDLDTFPPLVWMPPADYYRYSASGPMLLSEPASRFVLAVALPLGTMLILRFALWYRELHGLSRDQGKLIVQDTGWRENRRELSRQEKWRADAIDRTPTLSRPPFGCGSVVMVVLAPVVFALIIIVAMCCAGFR